MKLNIWGIRQRRAGFLNRDIRNSHCSLRGDMTAKRWITGLLALLVVAAVMAPSMMAQSLVTGDLTGTVTDPSGAVVSGASVTAKSTGTGSSRTTTTTSSGAYR